MAENVSTFGWVAAAAVFSLEIAQPLVFTKVLAWVLLKLRYQSVETILLYG